MPRLPKILGRRELDPGKLFTIEQVDLMDPYAFEDLLGMVYETQGYRVPPTPKEASTLRSNYQETPLS